MTQRMPSSSSRGEGLSDRAFAVREFQDLRYENWKKKHDYGKRWATETFFSADGSRTFF